MALTLLFDFADGSRKRRGERDRAYKTGGHQLWLRLVVHQLLDGVVDADEPQPAAAWAATLTPDAATSGCRATTSQYVCPRASAGSTDGLALTHLAVDHSPARSSCAATPNTQGSCQCSCSCCSLSEGNAT